MSMADLEFRFPRISEESLSYSGVHVKSVCMCACGPYLCHVKRKKVPSNMRKMRIQIILRMRKVSSGPLCCPPFIHSVVSNDSVSGL